MKVRQPKTITHQGVKYVLLRRQKSLGKGITEGPFYKKPGVNARYVAYTPDLSFLNGITVEPLTMHPIQMVKAKSSPKPTKNNT